MSLSLQQVRGLHVDSNSHPGGSTCLSQAGIDVLLGVICRGNRLRLLLRLLLLDIERGRMIDTFDMSRGCWALQLI